MKKIAIVFNHFQMQDGVARAAVGIANELAENELAEVTLIPLFRFEKQFLENADKRVKVKPVFKCYFRGFSKIVSVIPKKLFAKKILKGNYDIEIGFCMKIPSQLVTAHKTDAVKYVWMHGYDMSPAMEKCYKSTDKLVCVSKANADRAKSDCPELQNVCYSYNLVDDGKIREMGTAPVDVEKREGITFVSVGRMSPEKGFARLITAVKRLKDMQYNVNLWLVGDGPLFGELKALIAELKADDCCFMLGKKVNPHAYTSKADAFVCSSYSEGYSTAATEAAILGIPVITSDVPGGQEIIDDAECGLIYDKNSDEELFRSLKTVLDDPALLAEWRETMKQTGKKFGRENRAKQLFETLGLNKE